jgi:DNA (cytosine-5)-methyltransferase 1
MTAAYYNEIDPYAAQWLRNLIAAGHIAPGDVDERSIVDVKPDDLRGYRQCHFFAGIGGWSYALRLAGWGDDRFVWTGSCPCQPFSAAGKGKAADDERHLWPVWMALIRECKPATIFGEQVEAAIGWGWIDAVFADLEAESYACGASVLPACSVGAPHIRQRLWFVADDARLEGPAGESIQGGSDGFALGRIMGHASGTRLSQRECDRRFQREEMESYEGQALIGGSNVSSVGYHASDKQREPRFAEAGERRSGAIGRSGPWRDIIWLPCTDGRARPTQPGIFPLAHGVSARVGKLRAAGNAIVPQVAAEFIRAAG